MDKVVTVIIMVYFSYKFIKMNSDVQLLRLKHYIENNSDIKDGDSRFF